MTPFELVSVIEDADAAEPKGQRTMILELTVPVVVILGNRFAGKHLGPDPSGGQRFGYSRRQCLAMRKMIYDAASEDAAGG